MSENDRRYDYGRLIAYATALFTAAGLDPDKSAVTADVLVEGDLLGHTTHGLNLAPRYIDEMMSGAMTLTGAPDLVADTGACVTWNGRRLPGPWLTVQAVELALQRAKQFGIGSVSIANSHHIACLAAYLTRATDQGCMVIITSSDPAVASVAPFGGREGVYTPNPLAAGIPTDGDPILLDVSASITTNNMAMRLAAEGRKYDHPWLLDADGQPSNDPAVLSNKGTVLGTGGLDHGQKGYGLALLVEALTQALSGFGRADQTAVPFGASVFVQVIDPVSFAGSAAFERQTGWLARACRDSAPRVPGTAVRLPGERGLANRRAMLAEGVRLFPGIMERLAVQAEKLNVPVP